jgi:hypothetical protein
MTIVLFEEIVNDLFVQIYRPNSSGQWAATISGKDVNLLGTGLTPRAALLACLNQVEKVEVRNKI